MATSERSENEGRARNTSRSLTRQVLKHAACHQSIILFGVLLSIIHTTAAHPIPMQIPAWLAAQLFPSPGNTLSDEIKCYNLPYGTMGFVSHLLTYYTVTMLLFQLTPILPRPGSDLQHSIFDSILAVISLFGSVIIAGMNIYACRVRWQFICIGVWKLTLSFTAGVISVHQSASLHRTSKSKSSPVERMTSKNFHSTSKAKLWLLVYFLGTAAGMTGLASLVIQLFSQQANIRLITYTFASVSLFPLLLWLLIALQWIIVSLWNYVLYFLHIHQAPTKMDWKFGTLNLDAGMLGILFLAVIASFGLFSTFYCDWILAAIAGNWGGFPTSDIAILYWSYFVAKRLPMLSI